MTGKLTAIGIISMTVLLTGAGCVEAATTANTVFKQRRRGCMLLRSKLTLRRANLSLTCQLHDLP